MQRLIRQFSPEQPKLSKEMFPNLENIEMCNTDGTHLIDGLTGEDNVQLEQRTTFPTTVESSPINSPDVSHSRESSREMNRLWLQSNFNKSNPQLVTNINLPGSNTALNSVALASTPPIQQRTGNINISC